MATTYDIYFQSGETSNVMTYSEGSNISLLEITNSDNDYYQHGAVVIFNTPSTQSIGDTIRIYINDSLQFDGYVSSKQQSIDAGKKYYTYSLIGKTSDLWKYNTEGSITYTDKTTAYIASSLVSTYCTNISGNDNPGEGELLNNDITFDYETIGDALVRLIGIDGYKFYVDTNNTLQYYNSEVRGNASFTVTESDIISMNPIEESDSDIVNDVLVLGATDYTVRTDVSTTYPNEEPIPSGVLIAQKFKARDNKLSSIKLYLDRTVDPYQPDTLDFEIWRNTFRTVFTDTFDNWDYLNSGVNSYNMTISGGYLCIADNTGYDGTEGTKGYSGGDTGNDWSGNIIGCTLKMNEDGKATSISIHSRASSPATIYSAIYTKEGTGDAGDLLAYSESSNDIDGVKQYHTMNLTSHPILESGSEYFVCVWGHDEYELTTDVESDNGIQKGDGSEVPYTWDDPLTGESVLNYRFRHYITYKTPGGYATSGQIESYCYSGKHTSESAGYPCQYMNLDLTDVTSSNRIYLSGSNNSGSTAGIGSWSGLTDDAWIDFGEEDNAVKVRYRMSSNGHYTPKIGTAELTISDDSGGFEQEVFDDSFLNKTYISTQNDVDVSSGRLSLCLRDSGYDYVSDDKDWMWPSSAAFISGTIGKDGNWHKSPSNIIDRDITSYRQYYEDGTGSYHNRHALYKFSAATSTFSGAIDAVQITSCDGCWCGAGYVAYDIYISGEGYDWLKVADVDFYNDYTAPVTKTFTFNGGYYYSKVKKFKVKVNINGGYCDCFYLNWYDMRFRYYPLYNPTGSVRTTTQSIGSNDFNTLRLNETGAERRIGSLDYITYSASCDNGANWTKLTPNIDTSIGTAGNKIILDYFFARSGTGWSLSSTSNIQKGPSLSGSTLTAYYTAGGGMPKSGSKLAWSDDISFTTSDVVYRPSWSSWQTYASPKLALTKDEYYWLILNNPSGNGEGNGKYWSYFYDPKSTYTDGSIAYSWDHGINWSSNADDPTQVPSGNISFKLGWKQGQLAATSTSAWSISEYGRHFKKINDSNLSTEEQLITRASKEIQNYSSLRKKGTMTIDGRIGLSVEYSFSAQLTNYGINETLDIVSYTQRITPQVGFVTEINYGTQPYDIARDVEKLKGEVYG